MAATTVARLIFNSIVPDKYRAEIPDDHPIGSKEVHDILQRIAEEEPEKYKDISFKLMRLGSKGAVETGSSFSMADLESPIDKKSLMGEIAAEESRIFSDKTLDDKKKEEALVSLYHKHSRRMPELVYEASLKRGSNLAKMVASGARGNKSQLNSNIGADFLVMDQNNKPVPIGIKSSYTEGMSPAEYFAASYGTRAGLISVKFCQTIGAQILMADLSSKEIQEIKVGEWVMGADMSGKMRPVKVTNVFYNGPKECYEYTFRVLSARDTFVKVRCTPDHKILAETRCWTDKKHKAIHSPQMLPAGLRGVDEFIAVPQAGLHCESFGIQDDRALFLGLMLGDGHFSERDCFVLSVGYDLSLIESIKDYLAGMNFVLRQMSDGSPNYRLCYVDRPAQIRRIYDDGTRTNSGCPTRKWLKDIGLLGKRAHDKFIPDECNNWNNKSIGQMLNGLFTADGSIFLRKAKCGSVGATIAFASVSLRMIEQVKFLLEKRFGIYATKINVRPVSKSRKWAKRDLFDIHISHPVSVRRFMDNIGFTGYKAKKAVEIMAQVGDPTIHNHKHTFKRVASVPIGLQDTYDLEVDSPEHTYVLKNGIVVSNSTQDSGFLCLSKGCEVRMGDLSVKKIEDIAPGDTVMGADKQANTFPVRVVARFDNGVRLCRKSGFLLAGRQTEVACTDEHKFLAESPDGYSAEPVGALPLGSKLPALTGLGTKTATLAYRGELFESDTFDIEVDHPDHLFVLANGMIVSNSKQINAAAMDLLVTEDDCGAETGIPVGVDEKDNVGAVLAKGVPGYPAGTLLTPKIVNDIKKRGKEKILVRSAMTCQAHNGICSRCAGVRERGGFPPLSDSVGLAASSALSEPLSQGMLGAKHCIFEDELVRMADLSVKPIQDIIPGDWVLGADLDGHLEPTEVEAVWDQGDQDVWHYQFSMGATKQMIDLFCTEDHEILAYGDEPRARMIRAGDKSEDFSAVAFTHGTPEELPGIVVCPRRSSKFFGKARCYDLTVKNEHSLFALANGIIVHNSAGVANAAKITGFPAVNALFQVPETFPDRASLSEAEGPVERIEQLPQGGFNVVVGGQDHFVSPEHEILVKRGDKIEPGDRISSGTINPADVVRLKGVGAGRLNLLKQIQEVFHENGINVSRRNAEVVARGVIDHVEVEDADETSQYLPGETVEYSSFSRSYVPRENAARLAPKAALGKYLEKPVLHYSIGTRVTPSVAKQLEEMDEKEVLVSDAEPSFRPKMVRLMESPSYNKDWMAQMGTSYVQKNLKKNVVAGTVSSDVHGTHPLPALAFGKEFGKPPKGVVGY